MYPRFRASEGPDDLVEDAQLDRPLLDELRTLQEANDYGGYLKALHAALQCVAEHDCGEPLESLEGRLDERILTDRLVALPVEVPLEERLQLRSGIITRLNQAQDALPDGLRIVLRDVFRSADTVWAMYRHYVRRAMTVDGLPFEAADLKVRNFLAVPDDHVTPGHMTGAALDVILARPDGSLLQLKDESLPRDVQMVTFHPSVPREIRDLRRILVDAMASAGFHNYSREFWHYSFGDAYWAVRRMKKIAHYSLPPQSKRPLHLVQTGDA